MGIQNIKKRTIGVSITPIQKMKNISKDTGVNLFIKRDDLNGIGLGGNKIRKLSYLIEDASSQGCNVLLTYGGVQTNHGRLTAAVAAKYGFKCCIILSGPPPEKATGNLILDKMMNADLVFMDDSSFKSDDDYKVKFKQLMEKTTQAVIKKYEANGDKVYSIPVGGSSPLGILGYFTAIEEIDTQLEEMKIEMDFIITAYGSIGTYTGLLLGKKYYHSNYRIIGMNVAHNFKEDDHIIQKHIKYMNNVSKKFNLGVDIQRDDIWIEEKTIEKGYNVPDPETRKCVYYVAQREAVILDLCYTGKAFKGLMELIKSGQIPPQSNVLFIHTGGIPGIFSDIHTDAMQDELWAGKKEVYTLTNR